MDRTQYGKMSVTDTYRPYDLICKKKPLPGYALLADLQTNLNRVNTNQSNPLHHQTTTTTVITTHQPSTVSEVVDRSQEQHIYQNEDSKRTYSSQIENFHNGYHHDTNRHSTRDVSTTPNNNLHTYQNIPVPKDQMYRHEMREEVRTETRSSGPNPTTPQRSAITNNLSELDSLLQDLNTSKQNSIIKETTVVNGSRPTVDSLLDELNSVGHRETIEKRTQETRTVHQTPPVPITTHKVSQVSASNATKELDDLMESLSDFKVDKNTTQLLPETKKASQLASTRKLVTTSEKSQSARNLDVGDHHIPPRHSPLPPVVPPLPHQEDAPPRPPSPDEKDVLPVPPPRPPVPTVTYSPTPDILVPSALPTPFIPSPTPVSSVVYMLPDQPHPRPPEVLVTDTFPRPESGGPVKRNDAEYRWVTDPIKHEVREVVEYPPPPPEPEEMVKINASSLQTQVDTAYAKPLPKRHTPSPPPPPRPQPEPPVQARQKSQWLSQQQPQTPSPSLSKLLSQTPQPQPQPNQLDSMLGSLTTHMTEQGITTSQKGCCCACDKPIVGQVITALGKTWHPEHFTCTHCKEELGTKNFFERDGKPYCEPDYHSLFSPKCAYCSGPILDVKMCHCDEQDVASRALLLRAVRQYVRRRRLPRKERKALLQRRLLQHVCPQMRGVQQPHHGELHFRPQWTVAPRVLCMQGLQPAIQRRVLLRPRRPALLRDALPCQERLPVCCLQQAHYRTLYHSNVPEIPPGAFPVRLLSAAVEQGDLQGAEQQALLPHLFRQALRLDPSQKVLCPPPALRSTWWIWHNQNTPFSLFFLPLKNFYLISKRKLFKRRITKIARRILSSSILPIARTSLLWFVETKPLRRKRLRVVIFDSFFDLRKLVATTRRCLHHWLRSVVLSRRSSIILLDLSQLMDSWSAVGRVFKWEKLYYNYYLCKCNLIIKKYCSCIQNHYIFKIKLYNKYILFVICLKNLVILAMLIECIHTFYIYIYICSIYYILQYTNLFFFHI